MMNGIGINSISFKKEVISKDPDLMEKIKIAREKHEAAKMELRKKELEAKIRNGEELTPKEKGELALIYFDTAVKTIKNNPPVIYSNAGEKVDYVA